MAFIPVPNAIQCNVRGTYLGEQVENTLYFRSASPLTPDAPGLVAAGVSIWWQATVLPLLSASYQFREVYAVDLTTASSPTGTAVPLAAAPGGASGDPLPGNVALCVSFRTAARGRSFRGRNFVCGLVEPNVSGNTITTAWAEGIANAYEQLLIPDEFVNVPWVVLSRYSNNQPRGTGITTPVTNVLVVDYTVDSQRRRLPGRGR